MQQEGSCALIYSIIASRGQMSGVLYEMLSLIYIRALASLSKISGLRSSRHRQARPPV
jgi:hypothetical protein